MKLVDNVVPAADLVKAAKDWIKAVAEVEAAVGRRRLQAAGRPGLVEDGHDDVARRERALPQARRYDNYPAARAILQRVFEGLQVPFDTALRIESRYFAKIVRSPEAAAMIRSLFVSMQELNKGARRPAGAAATTLKKVGVLGAGLMGAGIAYVTRAGRHRRGADRPRPGGGRQGQGLFAEADGRRRSSAAAPSRPTPTRCSRASRATPDYDALKGVRPRRSRPCSRTAR